MRHSGRRYADRAGFSLVELLIVIAIIGLLIAILMPALNRARRAAIVLVSPVAYMGIDNRVHLTTLTGSTDLDVGKATTVSCHVCHVAPQWNPSGQLLATQLQGSGGNLTTQIISPASTSVTQNFEATRLFIGWLDSDRYLVSGDPMITGIAGLKLYVRTVDGRTPQAVVNQTIRLVAVAPTPPGSAAPYIGATYDGTYASVVLIRKDFAPGRSIWRFPANVTIAPQAPQMDPFGNFVAWTSGGKVNFKGLNDPPQMPPRVLGKPFDNAYFCDWTDGGDLLINMSTDGTNWRLAVVKTSGVLVNFINTAMPPVGGPIASYRKFQHR